jgi:hypothetical protein
MRSLALAAAILTLGTVARADDSSIEDALYASVRLRMRSLESCAAEAGALARKAMVSMHVRPDGLVADVTVAGPPSLAACVAGRVRTWKFSPFEGEMRLLTYPVVFVSGP